MTKIQMVQSLPDVKQKYATAEQLAQLQDQMQSLSNQIEGLKSQVEALPLQTSQLAAAILPLAQAMNEVVPLLQSLQTVELDKRLKAIESMLPRNQKGELVMLASQGTAQTALKEIREVKQSLAESKASGFFKKLVS